MRVKLTISYDGTNYYGFQHQKNYNSVEDELLNAISKIDSSVKKIFASGRTDRYVHAKGQVIHFDTELVIPEYKWIKAINTYLNNDIKVLECQYVDNDFHARFSCKRKEYRYYLRFKNYDVFTRNYMDYCPQIDLDKMENVLTKFIGKHDFKGFCSAQIANEKDTIKEIYEIKMNRFDDYIELIFIGNGFLKYQIRKMVGILVDIATGKKDEKIIDLIFETLDPKLTNKVLPGHGLYLFKVSY